jgi:hypothetical protein
MVERKGIQKVNREEKRSSEGKSYKGKKLREVNRMKEGSLEGESLIFVNLECDINF